jgi:hypothetical protein
MWWFGISFTLACGDPRSTLQHESISAELHALCACRVSMFAREAPATPICAGGTETSEAAVDACAIRPPRARR